MDTFIKLPAARRLLAFRQVDAAMGLQAASVEKDFWVCWTLRELFAMPDHGSRLTFKGGTSLSKAWKIIERFSEDIDLIVDKEALGFGGDATAPDKAPNNKQRRARLEALMDASRQWVQGALQPALASRMETALGKTGWRLEIDPDMPDGQCLLFHYPTVFPGKSFSATHGWITPRTNREPSASCRPTTTLPAGAPIIRRCQARCFSASLPASKKSSLPLPHLKKPSTPPLHPNPRHEFSKVKDHSPARCHKNITNVTSF